MKYTQLLIFEIGRGCNLSESHHWCPSSTIPRSEQCLDDNKIVETCIEADTLGFTGLIGFHYYNEPTLEADRIEHLIERIKMCLPKARFILWTNGTLINTAWEEWLGQFEQVYLTEYEPFFENFNHPFLIKLTPCPDSRLHVPFNNSAACCVRPFTEFIIDNSGTVHLCCQDWRSQAFRANIYDESFEVIYKRWKSVRRRILGNGSKMLQTAPRFCQSCGNRYQTLTNFDDQITEQTKQYIELVRDSSGDVALVFTHYKIPESRLEEHFKWNHQLYLELGIKVYIVTDKEYNVPAYAECLVYPDEMPIFNLSKTSNYGIWKAIRNGHKTIIKSDVDVAFDLRVLQWLCCSDPDEAKVPMYLMAETYEERKFRHVPAPLATGTISMSFGLWNTIRYDEQCEGYGCEDGLILIDLKNIGVEFDRSLPVYHIAHIEGTNQREFNGRCDHWNRDNGFNPNRIETNKHLGKLHKKGAR